MSEQTAKLSGILRDAKLEEQVRKDVHAFDARVLSKLSPVGGGLLDDKGQEELRHLASTATYGLITETNLGMSETEYDTVYAFAYLWASGGFKPAANGAVTQKKAPSAAEQRTWHATTAAERVVRGYRQVLSERKQPPLSTEELTLLHTYAISTLLGMHADAKPA